MKFKELNFLYVFIYFGLFLGSIRWLGSIKDIDIYNFFVNLFDLFNYVFFNVFLMGEYFVYI